MAKGHEVLHRERTCQIFERKNAALRRRVLSKLHDLQNEFLTLDQQSNAVKQELATLETAVEQLAARSSGLVSSLVPAHSLTHAASFSQSCSLMHAYQCRTLSKLVEFKNSLLVERHELASQLTVVERRAELLRENLKRVSKWRRAGREALESLEVDERLAYNRAIERDRRTNAHQACSGDLPWTS